MWQRPWTRRELLARGAAAGTALLGAPADSFGAPAKPLVRTAAPQRVVVIGAGLAGLVAAFELQQAGHHVTVLEARSRAGGRVLTLREPFADGMYAEAGALFIPDNHDHTLEYARRFALSLVEIVPRSPAEMFYVNSQRVIPGGKEQWPLALTGEERRLGYAGIYRRYVSDFLEGVAKSTDPSAATWPPDELKPYDALSMSDFLRKQGASEAAVSLLRLGYFDLWGDGADACSALAVLRDGALRLTERRVYSVRGGNDQLPKAFASKLAPNIRYGCPVVRIERGDPSVAVVYTQSGEPVRQAADHVVCAVPFSTLRKIEVTPPFSAEKQRAIAELPYTSVARVFLQSRRRFWRDDSLPVMTNTDLPIMWLWEPTTMQEGRRGILESYSAGTAARKMTAMREPERLTFTLDLMERVYPGMRKNFEGGASKCWDEDEWSRGDYAWFKPGQQVSLLPHIARPEGRIHFAGEHASAWPGWMQGALASGLRAAKEINDA